MPSGEYDRIIKDGIALDKKDYIRNKKLMLPDMPAVQDYCLQWFKYNLFLKMAKNTGFMQAMRQPEPLQEGNKNKLLRYDGTIDDVPMKAIDTKIEIKVDDLDQHGHKEVLKVLDEAARDMARQQSKNFFERLNQICDETGQVYDNKGQPLTFDSILDLLDSMPIDFDEKGQPIMPSILAGPRVIEKLLKQEPSDEQIKKRNEIIERKYSEWRDRESDRRLVG